VSLPLKCRKYARLLQNRRAISAVISNVILVGAVIAVSFVVLFWAQYRSSAYNEQYSEAMNSDIAKLKERLVYEYVFYDEGEDKLYVYLMNVGTVNNVTVQTVYVRNSTWFTVFSSVELKFLNGTSTNDLDIESEGYFILSSVNLISGESYSVRIITERGSIFDISFVA
jgi:hypothetical protein